MACYGIPQILERASGWQGQIEGEEGGDRPRWIELFGQEQVSKSDCRHVSFESLSSG